MSHQQLNKAEEIHAFDFIQGQGLVGMLLLNAQTYWLVTVPKPQTLYALPFEGADSGTPIHFFLHLLVNGPFNGLFSVGLGWGFYRQWQLDQQAGLDANRLVRRRMWTWLGLGLLHGLVVGSGDLLHQYALLGFTLVYFLNRPVSILLRGIAALVGLGIYIQIIQFLVVPPSPPALTAPEPSVGGLISQFVNTWQHGSFRELMGWQSAGGLLRHTQAMGLGLASYAHLEMLLLIGVMVGKLGLVDRLPEIRVRLSLWLVFLFPLAVLLKGISSLSVVASPLLPARWQAYEPLLAGLCEFVGTPLLTGVYLLEIGLNRRSIPHRVGVWIGQVGRMSLTNYLLQSGLCRLVFADNCLDLSSKLSLLASVGVVLMVYGFALWFSHWWLSHYPQGPVEQLLHRWTYGKAVARMPPYPGTG